MRPYTPAGNRTNSLGSMVARNDGENYGKLLLYEVLELGRAVSQRKRRR